MVSEDRILTELLQGADHWNAWVVRNRVDTSRIDFTQFDLREAQLADVMLIGANLSGANLASANLKGAKLLGAQLIGANLSFADMTGADMEGANLTRANLLGARLDGAIMHMVRFDGANLEQAHFVSGILPRAHFVNAILHRADFTDANLSSSNLSGSTLKEAIFNGADLRNAQGLVFDSNDIRGTRFTVRPEFKDGNWLHRQRVRLFGLMATDDPWSLLRRAYTGANLVLVWLALLAFLVPRALTSIGLYLLSVSERFSSDIVTIVNAYPNVPTDLVTMVNQARGSHQQYPVWKVVLGLQVPGFQSLVWGGLVLILFAYSVGRFLLTLRVVALRDAESRSGKTPARDDYERLYRGHRLLQPVSAIAFIFFLLNLWNFGVWFFTTTIYLP